MSLLYNIAVGYTTAYIFLRLALFQKSNLTIEFVAKTKLERAKLKKEHGENHIDGIVKKRVTDFLDSQNYAILFFIIFIPIFYPIFALEVFLHMYFDGGENQ